MHLARYFIDWHLQHLLISPEIKWQKRKIVKCLSQLCFFCFHPKKQAKANKSKPKANTITLEHVDSSCAASPLWVSKAIASEQGVANEA
jgi:hypothetical protein